MTVIAIVFGSVIGFFGAVVGVFALGASVLTGFGVYVSFALFAGLLAILHDLTSQKRAPEAVPLHS